jgi:GTP1/Obg family GTP-binding protein
MSKQVIEEQTKLYERIGELFKQRELDIEIKKEDLREEYNDKVLDLEMQIKAIKMKILDLKKEQRIKTRELDNSMKAEVELFDFQTKIWKESGNGRAFL